ncbi:hypothetical protein BC30048_p2003 (plasmid) [Bacillus cereus]|nr:hypothetical protein BCM0074_p1101 [Bacillus cereus]BCD02828.1 hypothetical protein BC30048_p2003 [Bacillus cereus]
MQHTFDQTLFQTNNMNKCTFCGRESNCHDTREVGGYTILECCTDCEGEILEQELLEQEQQEIKAWQKNRLIHYIKVLT